MTEIGGEARKREDSVSSEQADSQEEEDWKMVTGYNEFTRMVSLQEVVEKFLSLVRNLGGEENNCYKTIF